MELSSSSTKDQRWKRLFDSGLLNGNYSQRVLSCYGYLDSQDKGYFTLADFLEKGEFVENFLSLNIKSVKNDHQPSVMEYFRKYDLDGNGDVSIEEFAFTIMDVLDGYYCDEKLITQLATNIMPASSKNAFELLLLVQADAAHVDERNLTPQVKITALSYLIEGFIEEKIKSNKDLNEDAGRSTMIEFDEFCQMIKGAFKLAILEMAYRFHFHRKKLLNLFSLNQEEKTSIPDQIINARDTLYKPLSSNWKKFRTVATLDDEDDNFDRFPVGNHHQSNRLRINSMVESGMQATTVTKNPEFDMCQLYLLQLVASSIELILSGDDDSTAQQEQLLSLATDILPKVFPHHLVPVSPSTKPGIAAPSAVSLVPSDESPIAVHLSHQLITTQRILAQTETRLKVFELLQSNISANIAKEREVELSKVNDEDNELDGNSTNSIEINVEEGCTTDDLIQEIVALKSCAAFRGTNRSFLGHAISTSVALVDMQASSQGYIIQDKEVDSETSMSHVSKTGSEGKRDEGYDEEFHDSLTYYLVDIQKYISSTRNQAISRSLLSSDKINEIEIIQEEDDNVINGESSVCSIASSSKASLIEQLDAAENKIAKLSLLIEEATDNRTAIIHMAVELQMLREMAAKSKSLEDVVLSLRSANADYAVRLKASEELYARAINDKENSPHELKYEIADLKQQLQSLLVTNNELLAASAKLERENRRIKAGSKQAEGNMTKALQENLTLRQNIYKLEDELVVAVSFQKQLSEDVLHEREMRADREKLVTEVEELTRDISICKTEITELTAENSSLKRFKDELVLAEDRISELTDEVSLISIHIERADMAHTSMEDFRKQMREIAKEKREKDLYIHKLESQLNEQKYLQTRNIELVDELNIYKRKIEKIPTLLTEIARLRASNKAIQKALSDTDKFTSTSVNRMKQQEREIFRLLEDKKLFLHTDKKLQDANAEITQLSELVGELSAIRDHGNVDRVKTETKEDFARTRRQVRQSMLMTKSEIQEKKATYPVAPGILGLFKDVDSFAGADSKSVQSSDLSN